jgi:hypothetical protein
VCAGFALKWWDMETAAAIISWLIHGNGAKESDMAVCCRECAYWDNTADHRLPGTYAICNLVEGPDAPFNSLAYVESPRTPLVTRADYGCVQFKPIRHMSLADKQTTVERRP